MTPWTLAHQAPLSMEFCRQECWSGIPFPSPAVLPNPGIKLGSPTLEADFLPSEPPGKPSFSLLSPLKIITICLLSSVQLLSRVRLFAASWITARQASLSITNSRSLLILMSIEAVMPSSCLILCRPLLLLPSIPPSIRVFSNESTLRMRWPKHWSFSFSISPSNEHPGLISFRMDWLDLLAVQGTLKSPPTTQFKSINSSVLSFLHSPTLTSIHDHWKNLAFTRQTFDGKVMSLLFNMLSRLVTTFLPRSKCLLISWLQSPSAVILEPNKIKSDTASTVSPSIGLLASMLV